MATLGKALGVAGSFVAASAVLIEGLVQTARPFVYSTAMPPALAAAACTAIEIARFEDWRRERLRHLIMHFRAGAQVRGIALLDSTTPIQPVPIGASIEASRVSAVLEDAGFYIPAIRPPTVAEGTARLRIALTALHAEDDIERLLVALAAAVRS